MNTVLRSCPAGAHAWAYGGRAGYRVQGCDSPVLLTCAYCARQRPIRCKSSDCAKCGQCGDRYRRRVARIADSGRVRYPAAQLLMLTLTAPGDDVHHLPNGAECPCTVSGGVDLARWNAELGCAWNRFAQALRRTWDQRVEYFRVVEVQKRGALHLHVIVRLQRGQVVKLSELRALAVHHGFGHSVRCDPVRSEGGAWYVAKYCSKAAGQRADVPWRSVDPATGEVRSRAAYRCWTSSRRWGQSMGQLVADQRAWAIGASRDGSAGGRNAVGGAPVAVAAEPPLDPYSQRYTGVAIEGPSPGGNRPM